MSTQIGLVLYEVKECDIKEVYGKKFYYVQMRTKRVLASSDFRKESDVASDPFYQWSQWRNYFGRSSLWYEKDHKTRTYFPKSILDTLFMDFYLK